MSETQDKSSSASGELPVPADAQETIVQLQAENASLRAELEQLRGFPAVALEETDDRTWESEMAKGITYADGVSHNSARTSGRILKQLTGLSGTRGDTGQIRDSSDFDYLPKPSSDQGQLEADFVRWGYCLVEAAMSPERVNAQVDRLVEQAEAERNLDQAINTSANKTSQLVNNLVLKGRVFRDAVEFLESAAQKGPLVDELLTKIMGTGFGLGCAHGSIVHEGGGLQEIHIDQGIVPMPYPPFPFGSLIIWCYTEFNLENGGTYIVPGSHRSARGATTFHAGSDLIAMLDSEPGLVAICAPPGTCIVTDTRVLHCGGKRTASGTRYAMRCHYNRHYIRALHEHSQANLHVPNDVYQVLSDRLKHMMGISMNNSDPVKEMKA